MTLRPWAQWMVDRRMRWVVVAAFALCVPLCVEMHVARFVRAELVPGIAREWRALLKHPVSRRQDGEGEGA